MRITNGSDYQTPEQRQLLKTMAERWVNHHKHIQNGNPFSERYLDYLINLEQNRPGFGYAEGIEDDSGYLHCVLLAEITENMWVNEADANIIAILSNQKSEQKYLKILLQRFFDWADRRSCTEIYCFSWSMRPAYNRIFKQLGFEPAGYTFKRKKK